MSLVLNRVSLSELPLTASPGCLFGQRYCERYSLSSIVKFYTEVNCHTLRTFALRFMGPS